MLTRRIVRNSAALAVFSLFAATLSAGAQDEKHGRKYKAPPESSHITVEVLKGFNGKPISNAAVIFHRITDGKDEGSLDLKTGLDGKATIDVIPVGSHVRLQVIASGFATYGAQYDITTDSKEIQVKMLRPQEQVSTYVDNTGKTSQRQPGMQEPVRPTATPPVQPVTPQPPKQ